MQADSWIAGDKYLRFRQTVQVLKQCAVDFLVNSLAAG
jgi:hypothetical protein